MRIGANIPSLQAYNNMTKAYKGIALSNLRSSSGVRINSAADDAAGLAIATKIRQQVKGIAKASQNSSNATSLIQTADGALTEVHNMLQRIRELAVQAANDTNEPEDRRKMQDEIDSLIQEINDTPLKIEYNKIKMLNGECDRIMRTNGPAASAGLDILRVSDTTSYGELVFQVTDAGAAAEFNTVPLTSAPDLAEPILVGQTITVTIDDGAGTVTPYTTAAIPAGPPAPTQASVLAMINAVLPSDYSANPPTDGNGILGEIVSSTPAPGSTITVTTGDAYLDQMAGLTGISLPGTATDGPRYEILSSTNDPFFTLAGQSFSINGNLVTVEDTDTLASLTAKINAAADLAGLNVIPGAPPSLIGGFIARETGSAQQINVLGPQFVLERLGLDGAFTPGRDVAVTIGAATDIFTSSVTYTAQGARVTFTDRNNVEICLDLKEPIVAGADYTLITKRGPLIIQVGANKDMGMYMTIPKINAKTIEIDRAGVTTRERATETINIADKAIAIVSAVRSRLGAYQNRLEYTVTGLDNSYINASDSLSRIEDTDMAYEMTEYAKFNVMYQAGIALLAQSNARPQQILQLLQ